MASMHTKTYITRMDTVPHADDDRTVASDPGTDGQERLVWEATRIAEAEADIAAGRIMDSARVKAWIDSIGTNHELPVPYSGR